LPLTKLILQQKTSIDDGVPEVALMIVDAIFSAAVVRTVFESEKSLGVVARFVAQKTAKSIRESNRQERLVGPNRPS